MNIHLILLSQTNLIGAHIWWCHL